eukprot:CAMPEP_0194050584 /NCGR_PEP_ID=MMETSP0009_2-20130614/36087_1 /TAXON_ID=210454 /ORGANISM="Grammatophora oceanica, Strain CCMP 410" /LENGTH=837 /DNA_ID=CAMNT_0038697295 /DNA_START=47 /DNA_END=2560 /DNA_ORIENTATION=-
MDDDDGFAGYIPTTVDPGWELLVGTAIFCAITNALLPCFVALGRRYEKRLMEREGQGIEQGEETDEASVKEEDEQQEQRKSRADDEMSVITSSYVRGAKSIAKGKVTENADNEVSVVPGFMSLLDQIMIPCYPDDQKSTMLTNTALVGKAKGGSIISGDENSTLSEYTETSVLDAGKGRSRARGARRQRRALHDVELRRKTEEKEYDADVKAGKGNRRRTDDLDARAHGHKVELDTQSLTGVARRVPVARSDLSGSRATGTRSDVSRGRSRTRGGGESALSGATGLSSRRGKSPEPSILSVLDDHEISPGDAADADDPGMYVLPKPGMEGDELDLCCGENAWWRPSAFAKAFDGLVSISEYDREMKRILKLALPFSIGALMEGINGIIFIAMVGHFIGTESVVAYTIVMLLVGLTTEFLGGVHESQFTLCSHAYGAGNYKLAGQYVQISAILYSIMIIPTLILWIIFTDDVILLFGFDENVASIGRDYVTVTIFADWIRGLDEAYHGLLDVVEREVWSMSIGIAHDVIANVFILVLFLLKEDATLQEAGYIQVGCGVVFIIFNCWYTVRKGWVNRFLGGMLGSFTWTDNRKAYWTVFKTALPLSLGQLLAYGEWEILTIFAAFLGKAELATWGILGELWETFEELTEGIADAGEVRCSYHLGAGDPGLARISSYKSVLLGMTMGSILTSIVFILGEDLAVWLTPDPTLQHMIADLLPLVGLGNVVLTAGTVSWALVGAQARYRLATFVAFICSWCVTTPLAAISTYVLNWNLEGMVAAVVVGYSLTGTALIYILLRSDWDRLATHIVTVNQREDEELERERMQMLGDDLSSDGESVR